MSESVKFTPRLEVIMSPEVTLIAFSQPVPISIAVSVTFAFPPERLPMFKPMSTSESAPVSTEVTPMSSALTVSAAASFPAKAESRQCVLS